MKKDTIYLKHIQDSIATINRYVSVGYQEFTRSRWRRNHLGNNHALHPDLAMADTGLIISNLMLTCAKPPPRRSLETFAEPYTSSDFVIAA